MPLTQTEGYERPPGHLRVLPAIASHQPYRQGDDWDVEDDLRDAKSSVGAHGEVFDELSNVEVAFRFNKVLIV